MYLYIDESGNLGPGMGRYFLICALEIEAEEDKSIGRRAGRVICRFKEKNHIPKTREIKGSRLSREKRNELLEQIFYRGVKVRYIVLDLKQTTMLLEKADDKNACYNYLIQLLVRKMLEEKKELRKIHLYLDVKSKVKRIEFDIQYYESESCYLIQWADIVANALYKKYHSQEESYYQKMKPYIVFESKFPSKNFGK